jgi:hypothetical protein
MSISAELGQLRCLGKPQEGFGHGEIILHNVPNLQLPSVLQGSKLPTCPHHVIDMFWGPCCCKPVVVVGELRRVLTGGSATSTTWDRPISPFPFFRYCPKYCNYRLTQEGSAGEAVGVPGSEGGDQSWAV